MHYNEIPKYSTYDIIPPKKARRDGKMEECMKRRKEGREGRREEGKHGKKIPY